MFYKYNGSFGALDMFACGFSTYSSIHIHTLYAHCTYDMVEAENIPIHVYTSEIDPLQQCITVKAA